MTKWILILTLIVALHPVSAPAVDGVVEINQACATSGCFAGDSAGLPVEIGGAAGRSYRLTSDVVVPDHSTHGISITTHDVRIDLNGFSIIGTACVGATSSACRPVTPGSGKGIIVLDPLNTPGTWVSNGSVVGMGSEGVDVGVSSRVTDIGARWNGANGIETSGDSTASRCKATENGNMGFSVQDGGLVEDSTAFGNVGFGLSLFSGAGYRGNVISGNTAGTVGNGGGGGGVNAGGNVCNGSTTCP